MVTVVRSRNINHHRKFWALCKIIFDSSERYPNTRLVCEMFKIATGHVDIVIGPQGNEIKIPKSIDFSTASLYKFKSSLKPLVNCIINHARLSTITDGINL